MNRRRLALAVLGVLLLAAVVLIISFQRRGQPETWTVRRGDIEGTIEVSGRVAPANPVAARSAVESRVQTVAVAVGDHVQAGDILVTLDPAPLEARLRQAESQLLAAELAVAELERAGEQASLEGRLAAEQRLREAEAAYQEAQRALADTFVLAPIDGVVLEIPVTSGAPVGTGTVVAQLADLRDLGVSVGFDEVDLGYIHPGDPVTVTVDAFPGEEIPGRVVTLAAVAQQTAGVTSFPAFITLDAPEGLALRPGMTATVRVSAVLRRGVLVIPERAVRTVGERAFVTVLTERGEEEREVRLGLRSGGMVEVASGLQEGEHVILRE